MTVLCSVPNAPTPGIVAKGAELDAGQIGVSEDQFGAPQVTFGMKGAAVSRLSHYTTANAGDKAHMAIVLDGAVVTDPTTHDAITNGKGVINGIINIDTAKSISISLKYGALPIAFRIVATQDVGQVAG